MTEYVRITTRNPDGNEIDGLPNGHRTRVETASGETVPGVSQVKIKPILPDGVIEAELTVITHISDVWAQPFMSEESLKAAAERYGYRLSKLEPKDA